MTALVSGMDICFLGIVPSLGAKKNPGKDTGVLGVFGEQNSRARQRKATEEPTKAPLLLQHTPILKSRVKSLVKTCQELRLRPDTLLIDRHQARVPGQLGRDRLWLEGLFRELASR